MKKILVFFLMLFASTAYSADKIVVVPMLGDTNYLIEPANLVDFYLDVNLTSGDGVTAYTVPNDKVFVLTDIDAFGCEDVFLLENSTTKLLFNARTSKSFRSGITFSSGSDVVVTLLERLQGLCKLTFMGYLH